MKNSGYVAVGHLLNPKKTQAENFSTLRNFVNVLNLTFLSLHNGLIQSIERSDLTQIRSKDFNDLDLISDQYLSKRS